MSFYDSDCPETSITTQRPYPLLTIIFKETQVNILAGLIKDAKSMSHEGPIHLDPF